MGRTIICPASVGNFPPPERDAGDDASGGLCECAWQPYTFGIAGLYTADTPPDSRKSMTTAASNSRRHSRPARADFPAEKQRVARHSMAAAAAMTLLKIAAGLLSGSLGVLSDAAHSGLDLVGAALTYLLRPRERQAGRRRSHLRPRQRLRISPPSARQGSWRCRARGSCGRRWSESSIHPVEVHHSLVAGAGAGDFDRRGYLALASTASGGRAHRIAGAGDRRISFRLGHLGDAGSACRAWRDVGGRAIPDCVPCTMQILSRRWWFRS